MVLIGDVSSGFVGSRTGLRAVRHVQEHGDPRTVRRGQHVEDVGRRFSTTSSAAPRLTPDDRGLVVPAPGARATRSIALRNSFAKRSAEPARFWRHQRSAASA